MRDRWRTVLTWVSLLTIPHLAWAVPTAANGPRARLEGLILTTNGRAASGHRVQLIDSQAGRVVGEATTSDDGLYAFRDLPAGSYALGIENPEGLAAPVAAPPVKLSNGQLARRDIKLMESSQEQVNQAATANYGLGIWWAGLSTPAKIWTIVGIVTAAWITYEALSDNDEAQGSAFTP